MIYLREIHWIVIIERTTQEIRNQNCMVGPNHK